MPTPAGGLNLWCELPHGSTSALALAAQEVDVILAPGPSFAPEGGLDRFLRIPFTRPPEDIVTAIERLAQIWPGVAEQAPASARRTHPTMVA